MVTVYKTETHAVDKKYTVTLSEVMLQRIYPDTNCDDVLDMMELIKTGQADIEPVLEDAIIQNIELPWELVEEIDHGLVHNYEVDVVYTSPDVEVKNQKYMWSYMWPFGLF